MSYNIYIILGRITLLVYLLLLINIFHPICIYTDWVKNIYKQQQIYKKGNPPQNNVYIIGHSLDVTDGDVLATLINMPNTKTTIFYHMREAFGKQISNLVKILGEDELISKVHGSDASIVFCKQKENRICRRLPLKMLWYLQSY